MRRAKIVATLGPSSNTIEKIANLIRAGMNVARVNMSHGTHEGHREVIKNIREASRITSREVAILLDLQGPKIRVDKLDQPLQLKDNDIWVIGPTNLKSQYPQYSNCFIPTIYENLVKDSRVGCRVLFDDGLMTAEAIEKDGEVLKIKILVGGELKSNKGINLPDVSVSAPSFTQKDKEDLLFGLQEGIDYVALSFVRQKKDISEVKFLLHSLKVNVPIVAKIEKPEAITNLDSILEIADCIMIARGDMGVELGNHLVPAVQKKIIIRCNEKGVPVITATQMLESMIQNSKPTRAEASDVANAIWDGTDAVMLSGETASGKYPVEAIKMMSCIVEEAEKSPKERPLLRNMDLSSVSAATMVAASMIAEKVYAKWIISVTQSGNSAQKISRFRPQTKVLAVTSSIEVVRRMCLYWGVTPYQFSDVGEEHDNLEFLMIKHVRTNELVSNGDKIVITRGDGKFFQRGTSNSVRVEIIKDAPKVLADTESTEQVTVDGKVRLLLDKQMCASCQSCVQICPHEIWKVTPDEEKRTYIDAERAPECTVDMECVNACPAGAIELIPLEKK